MPRQLDAMPEQCTPRGTDARAPLLPPSAGGTFGVGSGARRLQSGRTFSSDLSFGSASTAGCVSLRMASSDINPKSLKVGPRHRSVLFVYTNEWGAEGSICTVWHLTSTCFQCSWDYYLSLHGAH